MTDGAATGLVGAPPPPPRMTGDAAGDIVAMNQWAWDFYRSVVLQNYYLQEAGQFDPGDFDPSTLPDPATATIATAQSTANEAYALAANAQEDATAAQEDAAAVLAKLGPTGEVTISGANTSATVTFTTAQADTAYNFLVQATAFTGSPTIDAFHITKKTKATGSCSFDIFQAPGVGNSVTYEFLLIRRS